MKNSVWLVAGLAYGDEGKGSVVDYLVRKYNARAVVRYNGGAQAGHRVVLPDGREHIFAQFGSGTLVPGTLGYLSRFMLVEPMSMMVEYEHLRRMGFADAFLRTAIDPGAPVITPFHIYANRILELSRGEARHGSCGLGIGETVEDLRELGENMLFAGDLKNLSVLEKKLRFLRSRKFTKVRTLSARRQFDFSDKTIGLCIENYGRWIRKVSVTGSRDYLKSLFKKGNVVFEGAQGMLLDPRYGAKPHITKTDITYQNALTLLRESGFDGRIVKVGVIRGYFTRHGAGPFPSEDREMTRLLPDVSNGENPWQGKFRVGRFDEAQVKYSAESIGGVDELAVTNLDRLIGAGFLKNKADARDYALDIAKKLGAKHAILSFGPTAGDKESIR